MFYGTNNENNHYLEFYFKGAVRLLASEKVR